jgi:hypothetical protein
MEQNQPKPNRGDSFIDFCWSLGEGIFLAGVTYWVGRATCRDFKKSGKHLKDIF